VQGSILDERYTQLLMDRTDLDLWTVILLDKVQKGIPISRNERRRLRKKKLIEGRSPNLFVAGKAAAVAGLKAQHIRNRGLDRGYYKALLLALIQEHGPVSREDIDSLLMDKLPEILSEKQKRDRIHNLLAELSGPLAKVKNIGSRRYPKWVIAELYK
jgi:ATP-dependent DNA helicase RecG